MSKKQKPLRTPPAPDGWEYLVRQYGVGAVEQAQAKITRIRKRGNVIHYDMGFARMILMQKKMRKT